MVAYELYSLNKKGEERLLGILPEKRETVARITRKSILKWGRMLMGKQPKTNEVGLYFKRVEL